MRKFEYFLLGAATGSVVYIMVIDMAFPSVDPSIWGAYAEAIGLRPSTTMMPILWRRLVTMGFSPVSVAMLSVSLLVFAVFDILWRLLSIMVCPSEESRNWWRMTLPVLAMLGCGLAVFSEPVWRLALSGAPALPTLALFMLTCDLFLVSFFIGLVFAGGERVSLIRPHHFTYAAFLLAGALVVETPVALVLPILFVCAAKNVSPRIKPERYFAHPSDLLIFPLRAVSLSVAGSLWLIGIVVAFVAMGMPRGGVVILRLVAETGRGILGAASPLGWVVWTGCTLVPFVAACCLLPATTGTDWRKRPLLFAAVFLAGIVSLAAVSPVARGDWAFFPSVVVRSPFMQVLGAVLAAMAATLTLAVFAYHGFHDESHSRAVRGPLSVGAFLTVALAALIAAAGMRRSEALQLRQLIDKAMDETVREAAGLSCLFTEGALDVGLKLAARHKRSDLRILPLVEDGRVATAENSVGQLRGWIASDSPMLRASGVQCGFELWDRAGKPAPVVSGLLARSDWPKGERESGIARSKQLREGIAALARSNAAAREADASVREAFAALQRCIVRMEERGRGEEAQGEKPPQGDRQTALVRLTDSEGLELALKRADFTAAGHFAASVLKRSPNDVSANFGMGMRFLSVEKKPKEAIPYLERAHKAKPTEPAILNNLAIACLQAGDVEQAETWAKKAVERAPAIPEVQDTLRQVEAATQK